MEYYRFIANDIGIYEAVNNDCPKNDSRRVNKPDGAWLPKEGPKYPGAISFWTDYGLKKYFDSGLLNWHASVVGGVVEIVVIDRPEEILYEDEYQIIFNPKFLKIKNRLLLDRFLQEKKMVVL